MVGYKVQAGLEILPRDGWEGSHNAIRQSIQDNYALSLHSRL